MSLCTICGHRFPWNADCETTHPDLCHSCGSLSWGHSLGYYAHPDPEGLEGLTAREREAVTAYEAHVARVEGR